MLGFLRPRGELIELKGRRVVFLSAKKFPVDMVLGVRLSVPEPAEDDLKVSVRILSTRPSAEGKYVVVSVLESPVAYEDREGIPLRVHRRDPFRISMKSSQLPGYRAVTKDLSLGGFQATLEGELVIRDVIPVIFEFDEPMGWTLELEAQVEWVQSRGGHRYDTGFSFAQEDADGENLRLLGEWLEARRQNAVKKLFHPPKPAPPPPKPLTGQVQSVEEPLDEAIVGTLGIRIPFEGSLRGWAWEQGDDSVVVVVEDDDKVDHWLEFVGCRAMHSRCRHRVTRLQALCVVKNSEMVAEYSRTVNLNPLVHYRFLDDHARVCIDLVASGLRIPQRQS